MKRILLLATVAVLASPADLKAFDWTEYHTNQTRSLEEKLRGPTTDEERRNLIDQIESHKHMVGPVDANGDPVQCRAFWRQRAIRQLSEEADRLARPAAGSLLTPVAAGKLHLRRAAAECLTISWGIREGSDKYQAAAFGQYLANNLPTLDRLFEDLVPWFTAEASPDAEKPEGLAAALRKARDGISRMGAAADTFTAADPQGRRREYNLAREAFSEFVEGLEAVCEAVEDLRPAAETPADTPQAPAAPVTDAEKARLARAKAAVDKLTAPQMAAVREHLQRYVGLVEKGFELPRARAKAREMLGPVANAADLADGIQNGKATYPEYAEKMGAELARDLERLSRPGGRIEAYAAIARLRARDRVRSLLDRGPLSPEASKGIAQFRDNYFEIHRENRGAMRDLDRRLVELLAETLAADSASLAQQMPPAMRLAYHRESAKVKVLAEAAGRAFPGNLQAAITQLTTAQAHLLRTQFLMGTQKAIDLVTQYGSPRSRAAYTRELAEDAVRRLAQPEADWAFERISTDLKRLDELRLPEQRHTAAARRLLGPAYLPALTLFVQHLTDGVRGAVKGGQHSVEGYLTAASPFMLARLRAITAADAPGRRGTANLAAFSLPDDVWKAHVAWVDQSLRKVLAEYASAQQTRRNAFELLEAAQPWYHIHLCVIAAQHLDRRQRPEGADDTECLLANLRQAAEREVTGAAQQYRIAGYHLVEAIMASEAGLPRTAHMHTAELRHVIPHCEAVELEP